MNDTVLLLLIGALAVIACVVAYNIYQENRFRNKIRAQFGGAQEDVLLHSRKNQVRDGEEELLRPVILGEQTTTDLTAQHEHYEDEDEQPYFSEELLEPAIPEEPAEPVLTQEETHSAQEFVFEEVIEELVHQPAAQESAVAPEEIPTPGNWLLDLDGMSKLDLPWFDKRVDFLAYVALSSLQELTSVPRLSNRRRYRVVGCTAHNRFQEAEAIPGVQYQAFVLGLQAIDRNGLTSGAELQQFKEHAASFAKQMNGGVHFTETEPFLRGAAPLDALCEEVDKVIAIHLVSRSTVLGVELRHALEQMHFELEHDGAFYYYDDTACPLYTVVTLDNVPFTAPLLAKQAYRGFSLLFSVALVKEGEKTFNQFMDIAVRLSSQLHLDLVDDKRQELSTAWLKEIREYVISEQQKMNQANVIPGEALAQRLFS